MARTGRRHEPPLIELLRTDGARFDFVQAVRLLEMLRPFAARPGTATRAMDETLRFRGHLSLAFPTSDIHRIELPDDLTGQQPVMDVSFMVLAGVQAPLPRSITELILRRLQVGDAAFRDFLDIFHHRLVSFAYRARAERRPGVEARLPHETAPGHILLALGGAGTPATRRPLGLHIRDILATAGLRTGPRRTLPGLERLLRATLSAPVVVEPFQGRWLQLAPELQARLTNRRLAPRLGDRAVLGRRFWDQTAGVKIRMGPLDSRRFRRFLPDGPDFESLRHVFRSYVGPNTDATVVLVLRSEDVPTSRLGRGTRPTATGEATTKEPQRPGYEARLGWTTWLRRTKPWTVDASITIPLRPRRAAPPPPTSA